VLKYIGSPPRFPPSHIAVVLDLLELRLRSPPRETSSQLKSKN